MKVKSIELGKRYKKEAVFLLIVASDQKDNKYMLMQMRTDGNLGFPGGMVDEGETLVHALIREVDEEMNIEGLIHPHSIPFCSHLIKKNGKKMATHIFDVSISTERLKEIISNSTTAKDYLKENRGNVIMTLEQYNDNYNKKLLNSNLASSVKEELEQIIPYFG